MVHQVLKEIWSYAYVLLHNAVHQVQYVNCRQRWKGLSLRPLCGISKKLENIDWVSNVWSQSQSVKNICMANQEANHCGTF